MDGDFRKNLDSARGIAEFVIALNLDIRGFSSWSLTVDSAQTALYIKKVYAKLIDTYFAEANLIKPTGDGLFVVRAFEESQLKEVVSSTVKDAIAIVETFDSLCDDDDMVNFDVPEDVGIGIARGSACRLASDTLTLDYSGHVLNLASRLMELARPRGVILDAMLGVDLLPEETRDQFQDETVYLKGVSPEVPVAVKYWPDEVEMEEAAKHPIGEKRWKHETMTTTRRELEASEGRAYRFSLAQQPIAEHELVCTVEHDAVTPGGRKSQTRTTFFDFPAEIVETAGRKEARFDQGALAERLKRSDVGPTWEVAVKVDYRVM